MTTTRTDIHRPVDFNPEDYEFIDAYDNTERHPSVGSPYFFEVVVPARKAMYAAAEAGRVAYGDGFRCDHCGARIRYVALFRHMPTGDVLAVGETCADGRMEYDKATFDRLRKTAQLDRQAARARVEWEAFRAERPEVDWGVLAESTNEFIVDVLRRGSNNGTLSERQVEAIVEAHRRDLAYAAERAEREANALPTMPVPVGNGITIAGVVLATKAVESDYGITWKMLVESTVDGHTFKVWGTIPRAIYPERGDVVEFVANVERSNDDPAFGFFKRPRKAVVVEEVTA